MYKPNLKIHGWMSEKELRWLYEQAQQMDTIAEIGSWRGRSTDALLQGCNGEVWAIDHWKGSIDERNAQHKDAVTMDIFKEFVENVGHHENLKILHIDHRLAANAFPYECVDMVFIDGCHKKEEARQDILDWLPKTSKLLCGHDFRQAKIDEIAEEEGFDIVEVVDSIWMLRR